MDREISAAERKKMQRKKIIRIAIVTVIIAGVIFFISRFLEANYSESDFITGVVDKGSIEITIGANGRFTPLIEEIITSPINTRILEVYKNMGDSVEIGEPLLKLELSSVQTDYEQKLDEREMRIRKLEQLRGKLQSDLSELEMQRKIKDMNLKQLYTELLGERHLDSIGASTTDKVRKAELNYEEAKLQLEQLEQKVKHQRGSVEAELRIQELDLNIFEKTLGESRRLLNNARILSPQKATLTYISNQIGTQVNQGTQLAVISDLNNLKIESEIADSHRDKLSLGAKTTIKSGEIKLDGTIVNISPSVKDGIVTFTVLPADMNYPGLRSGLKADIYVHYGLSQDVLRIPYKSTYYTYGRGDYYLWVIKNGKAVKRKVSLGERGFDYVEIISGLEEGDKVILSNMESFQNKKEIIIHVK